MTELNKALAMQAHSGTSFSPDERGRAIIDEFNFHLVRIREDLMKYADTEEERDFVDVEMRILKSGYASKMNDQLASQGRCVSTMIAGPSGFNTSKAQKANRAYENKFEATNAYLDRAISSIRRRLNKMQVEAAGGEAEVMKDNLRKAEEHQELMKAVNKILRSKKLSDEDKAQQVHTDLGLSEQLIHELMHPDWGKPGFASYQLTNNNANIRRMRERVEAMQAKEDTPTTEIRFDGGTIIDNCEDDRVQIDFDEKPDDAMRAKLKGSGWRWAPSVMMWQRKRTNAAMRSAKEILEVQGDEST
jgi:5-carboxymethyl-2-hydroxymuconate isomerase